MRNTTHCHRAAIVVFDGCYASIATGFADLLQVANAHIRAQQGASSKLFEWSFVSADGDEVRTSNGLRIRTRRPPRTRDAFDLIFIPAFHYVGQSELDKLLRRLDTLYPWVVSQWQRGALIAANCTGTFVLAATGLLDGRGATTTWWLRNQFRSRFPRVDLQLKPMLTETERLLCAGASASYLLLGIRTIENVCGSLIASQSAKSMLIDVSQTTQSAYLPLLAERDHDDLVVQRAQHLLQRRMSSDVRVPELASELAVSQRTLVRRFQSALGVTPIGHLQNLRIDAACVLLETSSLRIEQISAQVGYRDVSSFSRLFRERVGASPGSYRSRRRHPTA